MSKLLIATSVAIVMTCGLAHAEKRSRLLTVGDWTLDRVNGFVIKDGRDV